MRARHFVFCTLIVAAGLTVTACGLVGGPADRAVRRSPEFRAGYSDGCAAANAAGTDYRRGAQKNDTAYRNSRLYRQGWASGLQTCRRGGAKLPGRSNSPLPEPTPGYHNY